MAEPIDMNRRAFLSSSAEAALGISFIPVAACLQGDQITVNSNVMEPFKRLIDDFQTKIPKLMADAHVPGHSIAVIHDSKIVWRPTLKSVPPTLTHS